MEKWKVLLGIVIYLLVAMTGLFIVRLSQGADGLSGWRVGVVFFLAGVFSLAYSVRRRC